uniref:Small ribosomal subunit protein uS5m n=1 Tax=Timema tahoe TaxID=61484 RepID=A0A7R9FIL9_9NEOP|nr:unnamed protein product [Timema tahoe]
MVGVKDVCWSDVPAEEIWKGVTSVSNAGKKRGRGKGMGKKTAKNLNKGQIIGVGRANIVWPGLNSPVMRGRELVRQQKLPEDLERQKALLKMRDEMKTFRSLKLSPLERGWSGTKMPGRSIGVPDPVGEDTFDGFDTKVLEMKTVFNMKGNHGRKRRLSVLVVTGNSRGLAGFALGKAVDTRAALRKAKNRAGQKLMYIERYNEHTGYGETECHQSVPLATKYRVFMRACQNVGMVVKAWREGQLFGKTKVFVTKKPEGHGLICHRAIKTICEVLGIKDLYAKIEGPTNLQHIVKAFFLGLLQQKTHEQLAEEKGLHVVEFRKEEDYFPTVVASPSLCRSQDQIQPNEVLDFTQHVLGDRVVLKRKKFPPFYTKLPSWENHLMKMEKIRNHDKVRLHLLAEYGEVRSFLTEKYSECRPAKFQKHRTPETEEEIIQ